MSKIITLYGPDGSGKTTLSYALADRLADLKNLVLIVHTDFTKPVLNERSPELKDTLSLGHILMTGDNYNIAKSFIPYAFNENVFVTGILNNENYESYGHFPPEHIKKYLTTLPEIFDYIILDTTDNMEDGLALAGLDQCSHVIDLLPPNIQGVIFEHAYSLIFNRLHTKEKTVYAASKLQRHNDTAMIEKRLNIRFSTSLPYSEEVDYKSMSGAAFRHFQKKPGIAYEKQVEALRDLVG